MTECLESRDIEFDNILPAPVVILSSIPYHVTGKTQKFPLRSPSFVITWTNDMRAQESESHDYQQKTQTVYHLVLKSLTRK